MNFGPKNTNKIILGRKIIYGLIFSHRRLFRLWTEKNKLIFPIKKIIRNIINLMIEIILFSEYMIHYNYNIH